MPEWITSVFAILGKSRPEIFLGMAIASGVVLFADAKILNAIHLSNLRNDYGTYLGLIFVLSLSLLLAQGVYRISAGMGKRRKEKKNLAIRLEYLHELTPDEKSCLGEYIIYDEATQYFAASDGVAQGLATKKIIVRTSNLSTRGMTFPYSLQPWARRYLITNRYLLD